ncbi:LuxR family transcriptional regulator [Streptomyces sp. PTM05]|uniref:LuxR family transcriptional regulator n=1 Tax=Streptantibioticus parmotrematis TaxID=2873249 RepID=A0ABS7QPV9_9ACTN|nr:LuxR family transcriptional regulator [Streptantibioticus parmotrematis]MBY8885231.1 LuxR family transcriptional regulator [Streptantibioticus parmotrematis]
MTYTLRGRASVRDRLVDALTGAACGRGHVVVVEGPAGSGRSRMLAEAETVGRARGFVVCRAMADHLEHPGLLAPLGVSGDDGPTEGGGALRGLTERLLRRSPQEPPVLLAIDDLRWAQPSALDALRTLSGVLTVRDLRVCLVLSRTPDHDSAATERFLAALSADGASRLRLGPLPSDDAIALAAEALGVHPSRALVPLCEVAQGVPARLLDLAEALRDGDPGDAGARLAALSCGPLPERLREEVLRPVRSLSSSAAALLDVVAVLGGSASLHDLGATLRRSAMDLMPAIQECAASGVLTDTGGHLVFRYPLVRRAVQYGVPHPVRAALRYELGERQLAQDTPASSARHFAAALRDGEARALPGLERAGRSLALRAPASAVSLLGPLAEEQPPGTRRSALRLPVAMALQASGRLTDAAELADAALAEACDPSGAVELALCLAESELMAGAYESAASRAASLSAAAQVPDDVAARAEVVLRRARCRPADAEAVRSVLAAPRPVAVPGGGAVRHVVAADRVLRATALWHQARPLDALAQLSGGAERPGAPSHPTGAYWDERVLLGALLVDLGDLDRADEVLGAVETGLREAGLPDWLPSVDAPRAALALERGDTDWAELLANGVLADGARGRARPAVLLALGVRAECAVHRGRYHEARTDAAALSAMLRDDAFDAAAGRASRALVRCAEAERGAEAAAALLADLCASAPGGEGRLPAALLLAGAATPAWLVGIARTAGRRDLASDIAARARDCARDGADAGEPGSLTTAAEHAEGVLRQSAALLSRVADAQQGPWARARAQEDLGTVLLAALTPADGPGGRPAQLVAARKGGHAAAEAASRPRGTDSAGRERAVQCLQAALKGYDVVGAAPDAARVRGLLRTLGVRRRHWRYANRPAAGWASLTDTERAVADLVAQGLTNRETAERMFLSPYTVNFHLRQIFRKLSITSRVELARMHRDLERTAPLPVRADAHPAAERDERRPARRSSRSAALVPPSLWGRAT